VFDAQDDGARAACGLINLPGYTVTPQARVGELQVQPVPRNSLQQRDAIVVALLGLTIAVVGGALFVKGAMAGFLRFWLARLCYEQQAQADRIAATVTGATGNGAGHDERAAVG
jgi:hypothetical protein